MAKNPKNYMAALDNSKPAEAHIATALKGEMANIKDSILSFLKFDKKKKGGLTGDEILTVAYAIEYVDYVVAHTKSSPIALEAAEKMLSDRKSSMFNKPITAEKIRKAVEDVLKPKIETAKKTAPVTTETAAAVAETDTAPTYAAKPDLSSSTFSGASFANAPQTSGNTDVDELFNQIVDDEIAGHGDRPVQRPTAPRATAPAPAKRNYITPDEMSKLELTADQTKTAKDEAEIDFNKHAAMGSIKRSKRNPEFVTALEGYRDVVADVKLKGADVEPADERKLNEAEAAAIAAYHAKDAFIKGDSPAEDTLKMVEKIVDKSLLKTLEPKLFEKGIRTATRVNEESPQTTALG